MDRQVSDNYPTPKAIADYMVDLALKRSVFGGEKHNDRLSFFEPGCGDFAPFAARADKVGFNPLEIYTNDIRDVQNKVYNFEQCDFCARTDKDLADHQYDIIATNPPYGSAEGFIRRSLVCLAPLGVAVFLLRLGFLESQKRYSLFKNRPPAEVHVLVSRPSFVGNGSTDSSSYGIFLWRGLGAQRNYTELFWVDNSGWKNKA